MQDVIEGIRKVVVLILLMELVLQLGAGKEYEPYMRLLIGIMVVYSLVAGIFGTFSGLEHIFKPMQEMQWIGEWMWEFEDQAEELTESVSDAEREENTGGNIEVRTECNPVSEIQIEEIRIGEIRSPETTR